MKIALWVVQVLLALAFGMAGFMKATTPAAELTAAMPWVEDTGLLAARIAGVAEILGALGLVLPAATRIMPKLTPLAAAGLSTVMVLGSLVHLSRGELGAIVVNLVLFSLTAFVVWGRIRKAPITPRGGSAAASSAPA